MAVVGIPEAAAAQYDPTVVDAWQRAHVAVPKSLNGDRPILGKWRDRVVQKALGRIPPGRKVPAVILLHGCSGIGDEEEVIKITLVRKGFATFLPNSFARTGRRSNCDILTLRTSRFPKAHDYRMEEIDYALEQLRRLPWIDHRRIFLMGYSEGGMAVARYERDDVAGIVITAWHCRGRMPFVGIKAPPSVPVLAIIGENDPWYPVQAGQHCGDFFDGRPQAESLILPDNGHQIINSPVVENAEVATQALLRFLRGH
jgi:dienelactone hydrolase